VNDPSNPINLREYEAAARAVLPPEIFDWCAGGAGDEITLRENEAAWAQVRLQPRAFVDVSDCSLGTAILGREVSMPVMTAPCSLNRMVHPDGELAVARAAAGAGIIQVVSMGSTASLEDIAAAAQGPRWCQLYCLRDRGVTRALAQCAEAAGFAALCVTVDAPVDGIRERTVRNGFRAPPPGIRPANLPRVPDEASGAAREALLHDRSAAWDVVEWLRGLTRLPVVAKGILNADDARLAVAHGASGLVVSNHGGRQLDSAIASCDALPRIVDAVSDRSEVYVDGGIRRGADVLKALALGARAVLIGRPFLWGLAVDGETGVRRVLEILRTELENCMALAGCARPSHAGRALIAGVSTLRTWP